MTATRLPSVYLLALAVLLGCGAGATDPGTTPDPDPAITEVHRVAVGDTAVLGLGDSVVFQATGIRAEFVGVVADSRCPVGVTCVWEGDAEVSIDVVTGGGADEVRLHTTLDPTAVDIASYELQLVDLHPYPVAGPTTDVRPLRLLLRLVPAPMP